MNDSGNQQGMSVQASGVPGAPGTGAPQATMEQAQTQPQPTPLGFFDRVAAFVRSDAGKAIGLGLGLGLGVAAIAAIANRGDDDEDASSSPRNPLDANRRAGARYERAVAEVLADIRRRGGVVTGHDQDARRQDATPR